MDENLPTQPMPREGAITIGEFERRIILGVCFCWPIALALLMPIMPFYTSGFVVARVGLAIAILVVSTLDSVILIGFTKSWLAKIIAFLAIGLLAMIEFALVANCFDT